MMHRLILTLAFCVACNSGTPWDSAVQGSGGFIVTAGADTVIVERYSDHDGVRRGTVRIGRGFARLDYDGSRRGSLEVVASAGDAPTDAARRRITVRSEGGLAHLRMSLPSGPQSRAVRVNGAFHVYMPPSVGLLEEVVRGSRSVGTTQVLSLPSGSLETVRVERIGVDSVAFTLDGNRWQLAVDLSGRILGGRNLTRKWIVSRVEPPTEAALKTRPSRYAAPPGVKRYGAPGGAPYSARDVQVTTTDHVSLAGTLTVPRGGNRGFPAVLLVSGSSPQDRDMAESNSPYRPFAQIADTLGRRGIAVLRLDDRGVGESGGRGEGMSTADRADDMRQALAFLRKQSGIDASRVAILGLSEGGSIAPMLASQDSNLRGIVLINAPGDSGAAVARYQTIERVAGDPRVLPAGRDSAVKTQMSDWLSRAATDRWIAYFIRHDPLAVAGKVKTPVLILHGLMDRNVPPNNATRLRDAFVAGGNRDVTVRLFPEVSHGGYPDVQGGERGEMYVYSVDLAPALLGVIVDWLVLRL
ncbi:MAG: alpha/beta fold hydrolase [Gemmatimonadaceae bacterium]